MYCCFVLFYVMFVCKCVLPPGDNPIAVNKYIISKGFHSEYKVADCSKTLALFCQNTRRQKRKVASPTCTLTIRYIFFCFFLRWLQTISRILHRIGHDCFHPNPIHMAIRQPYSRYTYVRKYKQQTMRCHILETLRLNIHSW